MIMRKFHNSMAVGFFMGGVVCTSQLFFLLFLVYVSTRSAKHARACHTCFSPTKAQACILMTDNYLGSLLRRYLSYVKDQRAARASTKMDSLMAVFALIQSVLLGSFAAILAAHRSEILDQPSNAVMTMMDEMHGLPPQHPAVGSQESSEYDPPTEK